MPEVIFTGPAGRLEGRYQPSTEKNAPIAIVLHPHPQFGGTMNNKIVYDLFYMFQKRNFTTLRFNFRVDRPQPGRVRPWHRRAVRRGGRTRLDPVAASRFQELLGRRLFLRRLDRHAAPDAPAGDRGLHLGRAAAQHL